MTTDDELEEDLTDMLRSRDLVSDLGRDTAKALLSLRNVDDKVAELVASELSPARGGVDLARFAAGDISVTVSTEMGRLHIVVSPANAAAWLENASGSAPIALDEAGSGSVAAAGVVRVRLEAPDGSQAVTDPIRVPKM